MAEETAESMVRAGATLILSYFTPDFLDVSTASVRYELLLTHILHLQWLDLPPAVQ